MIIEATGFGEGAVVPGWCARVYRDEPRRLEWAYGATSESAQAACEATPLVISLVDELPAVVVEKPPVCVVCNDAGFVSYGVGREVDCECVEARPATSEKFLIGGGK